MYENCEHHQQLNPTDLKYFSVSLTQRASSCVKCSVNTTTTLELYQIKKIKDQCLDAAAVFTSKGSVISFCTWLKSAFRQNLCDKPLSPLLIPACISWTQGKYYEIRKLVICQSSTSIYAIVLHPLSCRPVLCYINNILTA